MITHPFPIGDAGTIDPEAAYLTWASSWKHRTRPGLLKAAVTGESCLLLLIDRFLGTKNFTFLSLVFRPVLVQKQGQGYC